MENRRKTTPVERLREAYAAYRSRTAFLIPFAVTRRRALEIAVSVGIPVMLLWGLVLVNRTLYP